MNEAGGGINLSWNVENIDVLSTEENKQRVAEARAQLKRNRNYEDGK